jgi:hypothetical protein
VPVLPLGLQVHHIALVKKSVVLFIGKCI